VKRRTASQQGFTLAEVAVTVLIVGTMLIYLLQGLSTTKMLAAHTRNTKLARELAVYKLGQIGSGLYQEDIDRGISGTFSEEGYPDFTYEVVVGDETFIDQPVDDRVQRPFDSWAPRDSSTTRTSPSTRETDAESETDEEVEEPFEKVRIRISFPKLKEYKNELTMERWFPWAQVYGSSEEEDAAEKGSTKAGGTNSPSTNSGSTKP
jgi:prepilin-type N-terminal cleavage/methylation domain-containing protein